MSQKKKAKRLDYKRKKVHIAYIAFTHSQGFPNVFPHPYKLILRHNPTVSEFRYRDNTIFSSVLYWLFIKEWSRVLRYSKVP